MRPLLYCVIFSTLTASSLSAETTGPDVDDWYKNHYAPLFAENPWDNVEELLQYFTETQHDHTPDGPTQSKTRDSLLILEEWRSQGWLSSTIETYKSEQLNRATAIFKVKWLDRYEDGSVEFACSWYLADLEDGIWRISEYAELDCDKHGL